MVGFYLAHSYRRQIVLRVAEQRLSVYATLWSKMSIATPVRTVAWNVRQPLTTQEREELFRALTAWYFENGNGMLLGDGTRSIYVRVKDNLVCPIEYYEPESIREKLRKVPPEEAGSRAWCTCYSSIVPPAHSYESRFDHLWRALSNGAR